MTTKKATKKDQPPWKTLELPVTFRFRARNHRIVDPKNPPRNDKRTGEAVWGNVVVAKEHRHTCDNRPELKWMLEHKAFGNDFWIEGNKPVLASQDRVVTVVTAPPPPGVNVGKG